MIPGPIDDGHFRLLQADHKSSRFRRAGPSGGQNDVLRLIA